MALPFFVHTVVGLGQLREDQEGMSTRAAPRNEGIRDSKGARKNAGTAVNREFGSLVNCGS